MTLTSEEIDKVRIALEKPQYTWRTLKGVTQETGLPLTMVRDVIRAMGAEVVKSDIPSVTGEDLYATVTHYQELKPKPADVQKVIEAMNDPKYTWRTARGIAAETGLSEAMVLEVINANRDAIIQSEFLRPTAGICTPLANTI